MEEKKTTQGKRFARAIAATGGIVLAGICVQWFAGPFNISLLAWPVNLLAVVVLGLAAGIGSMFPGSGFSRAVSGAPLSAALICGMAAVGIVMGLVPQVHHSALESSPFPAAVHTVTSSWPFVFLYTCVLFVLMCVVIRRAVNFKWRDYAFYLNHAGLLLLLVAAGPGGADKESFTIYAYRDTPQDGAYFLQRELIQLPFTVTLNGFDIEYYPASVMIAGNSELLRIDYPLDGKFVTGEGCEAVILDYIHEAVKGPEGFIPAKMPGATPAALVSVEITATGERYEGWVSAGNAVQNSLTLDAGGVYTAYMPPPEPKRYTSTVTVDNGHTVLKDASIEVNKPLRFGHWSLYQYGYDTDMGRMSPYSIIQLVYDPWLPLAYAGIVLLAAGCLGMVWTGRNKRRKEGTV